MNKEVFHGSYHVDGLLERLVAFPKDTHPHKTGDDSGYDFLWEEMDRAFGRKKRFHPTSNKGHRHWEDVTWTPQKNT